MLPRFTGDQRTQRGPPSKGQRKTGTLHPWRCGEEKHRGQALIVQVGRDSPRRTKLKAPALGVDAKDRAAFMGILPNDARHHTSLPTLVPACHSVLQT